MNDGDPETASGGEFETQGIGISQEDEGLVVDLTDVKEMSWENIPKGIYDAVIDECKYEISKNSSKPMWSMRFAVVEGEFANRKQFTYVSFSEKALGGTKRQIKQFAPELLAGPFNAKKIADEGYLIGKPVRIKVDIEPYKPEGQPVQMRNRVKDIMAPRGGVSGGDGFLPG
jgi:hypothetical protein